MFFVVAVSCDSFYIISKCFMFVNNFFKLFFVAFLNLSNSNSDILSYIFLLVNNFFEVFFKSYFQAKRRKRDSNPRAAINDLLTFQASPFSHLGTSPSVDIMDS